MKESITSSIQLIIKNSNTFSIFALIMLLSYTIGTWLSMNSVLFNEQVNFSFGAFSFFFDIVIFYLLIKTILKIKGGQKLSFATLQVNVLEIVRYFIVSIVSLLLMVFGLILFIIPGIYFATKYFFAIYLLLDKKLSIIESFKKSAKLTEKRKLRLVPILFLIILPIMVISTSLTVMNLQYLSNIFQIFWTIFTTVLSIEVYKNFETKQV